MEVIWAMVWYRPGLAEATSIALADVADNKDRPPSQARLHSIAQVGGALVRQLRKRFDSDEIDNLDDDIINQAYRNEIARVVHGWPETLAFMCPMRFYGTTHLLRRAFARYGWAEKPGVSLAEYVPSVLDQRFPAFIRKDENRLIYATREMLTLMNGASPSSLDMNLPFGWMLDRRSRSRAAGDRERMLSGVAEWIDTEYDSILPSVPRMLVVSSTVLSDDDDDRIGELTVLADAAKVTIETRSKIRYGGLKVFAPSAAALMFSMKFVASLCIMPYMAHVLAQMNGFY